MLFHQFRGTIGVATDKHRAFYRDSDANFATDSGLTLPALPAGIDERLYEPGVRHALLANNNVVDGGPMPWEEGDHIIERASALIDAQKARVKRELDEQAEKNALALKK